MPASKQSGALKVAMPLIAAVILFTLVFGPSLTGNKKTTPQQTQQGTDSSTEEGVADTTNATDENTTDLAANESATNDTGASEDEPNDIVVATPETDAEIEPATDASTPDPGAPALTAGDPNGVALPDTWRVRDVPAGSAWSTLGSADPADGYELELTFAPAGAGLSSAVLTNHYLTAVQSQRVNSGGTAVPGEQYGINAFRGTPDLGATMKMIGARAVFLTDSATGARGLFDLSFTNGWRETAPGAFELVIVNGDDEPVVVITRRFELVQDSYDIPVTQTLENRSGRPLEVVWYQYGPADLPPETAGYRLESRRVRLGYTLANDPQFVKADGELRDIPWVVKKAEAQENGRRVMWPDQEHKNADTLSWVAQTNRHFMFAIHPPLTRSAADAHLQDPNANPLAKGLLLGAGSVRADAVMAGNLSFKDAKPEQKHVDLEMATNSLTVQAGDTLDLSFGVYLGPLSDTYLTAKNDPVYVALNLRDVVIYQIGFCGVCTFQWIARPLLGLLRFFEGNVVFDWGLAIILLVVCVRALLHPITKKSQVSMMRFGKQMQRLAPKQKKIQERYKDDRQRMNQEMAKLMREEQINPLGMLGCLPMFLQTPIWIALYATIYFAFDLRHQPAFFGIFQNFGGWTFLNDLSSPDHFIDFGHSLITIPLMGSISGLNILPLLMGAIFFVQQKYMSPPPSGNASPEQEQTQKLMKIMLVVMMPIFMYNAPSGLTLYILTSSSIGILESRYVRAHVDQMDLDAPPKKKPTPNARKQVKNAAFGRGPEPRKHFKDRGKG